MFNSFRSGGGGGGSSSPVAASNELSNTIQPSTSRRRRESEPSSADNEYDQYYKGYWRNLVRLPSTMGKQSYLDDVEARCVDAGFCSSCMIGPNERLVQVLTRDEETLRSLGITRYQIADVLETIDHLAGEEYLRTAGNDDKPVTILNGRYQVKLSFYGGSQRSPFQHPKDKRYFGYDYGDHDLLITRFEPSDNDGDDEEEKKEPSNQERHGPPRESKRFAFGSLLIPMIRYNGFFEGKGVGSGSYGDDGMASFRIDPREVVDFFNIQPRINYSILYQRTHHWKSIRTNLTYNKTTMSDSYFELSKHLALDQMKIPNTNYIALLTWIPSLLEGSNSHKKIYASSSTKNVRAVMSTATVSEQIDYILTKYGKHSKGGWFGGSKKRSGGSGGGGGAAPGSPKQNALDAIIQYHSQRVVDSQSLCLELFQSATIENEEDYNVAADTAETSPSPPLRGEGGANEAVTTVFGAELALDKDVLSSLGQQRCSYICFQQTTHRTVAGWNQNIGLKVEIPPALRLPAADAKSVTSSSQGSLPSHTSSFDRQFVNNSR